MALEIMPGHLHLFVNAPPTLAPHDIVARLKGVSLHHLRREFDYIARMPSMWSSETIRKYIEAQKKRG